MKINKILKISFQNIKRNKKKNSILFIPLTFLLILLFITSTIQYSIYAYLDKLSQSLQLRTISGIEYPEKKYEEIKEQIEKIEHVEWVYNQEVERAFSIFTCQEFIYGKADGYSTIYPTTPKVYPELLAGRPINEGEKYVALAYKYRLIDQDYKLAVLNEVLCNVEYQEDGSSATMWKQYVRNPNGFAFWRKICMQYPVSQKRLWIDCIHYVSESIIAGDFHFIKHSTRKVMTVLALPLGLALSVYTRHRVNKQ